MLFLDETTDGMGQVSMNSSPSTPSKPSGKSK